MTHEIAGRAHLIIGGATKAGSTSLFAYLSEHPEVCAAYKKETRFFLEADYPAVARHRLEDGLEAYAAYFPECDCRSIYFDSSPQYLYSNAAAERIYSVFPQARLVFILREPIDRLLSFYQFAKQRAFIPQDMDLRAYIDRQLELLEANPPPPDYLRTLPHGRYSQYLPHFQKLFPQEQLLVLQFEELKRRPVETMKAICRFAGIDGAFFEHYAFQVHNATRAARSSKLQKSYAYVRRNFSRALDRQPQLWRAAESVHLRLYPKFLSWNGRQVQPLTVPDDIARRLEEYYQGEEAELARLLSRPDFSWSLDNDRR